MTFTTAMEGSDGSKAAPFEHETTAVECDLDHVVCTKWGFLA